MATLTTNFSLNKPAVNDAVDQDLWGTQFNTNMDTIDSALLTARDYVIREISSTDSLVAADRNKTLLFTSTGDYTFSLLSATEAGDGFCLTLVKDDASNTNTITIDGSSNQTIGEATTYTLNNPGDAVIISSKGTTAGWSVRSERRAIPTAYGEYGCILSNDSGDTANDINFTAGQRISTSNVALSITSEMTKQSDSTWASGDDAGGRLTSGLTAGMTLHAFLIQSDSDNSVDIGLSTDPDCGDIPSGYTNYAYIHSLKVTASTDIPGIVNEGELILYTDPIQDVNVGGASTSGTNYTMSVPTGFRFMGYFNTIEGAADGTYYSCPDVNNEDASVSAAPLMTEMDGGNSHGGQFLCLTSSGQIRSRSNHGNTIDIVTLGYERLKR